MLPDFCFLITPELLIAAPQFSFSFYFSLQSQQDSLMDWLGSHGSDHLLLTPLTAMSLPIPSMGQTDQRVVKWNDVVLQRWCLRRRYSWPQTSYICILNGSFEEEKNSEGSKDSYLATGDLQGQSRGYIFLFLLFHFFSVLYVVSSFIN